jgi:hypothetical protein
MVLENFASRNRRCRGGGLQVCRSAGLQVCWSSGLQVCWSSGLLVFRSAGLQVFRSAGLQVCWSSGLPAGFVFSVKSCSIVPLGLYSSHFCTASGLKPGRPSLFFLLNPFRSFASFPAFSVSLSFSTVVNPSFCKGSIHSSGTPIAI